MSQVLMARLPDDASLFHFLVDSVQDYAIFVLDEEGRISTWNPAARQIKGYEASEVIGQRFSLFFTDEDRAAGRPDRLLATARADGRVADEGWRVRKDGSHFWASAVISVLRTEDGEAVGFAKVTRDLTERRAVEEALRKRERQLVETQALAGLGSWEWDVARDTVGWTDELYRIYGVEPQSFTGTFETYLALVHPEDRERVRGEVERAYREGRPFEFEERIVRPDGDIRILRSRGLVVRDAQGATTHLLGSCLDITDLRHAQDRALALVREQSAREAAEDMAARLRFLVQASETLSSSTNCAATLQAVAELAVHEMADTCAFDLADANGALRRVAFAQRGTAPSSPGTGSSVTVALPDVPDALGTLTLTRSGPTEALADGDVWLARELARHAAAAIVNARLHEELEQRNAQLEEQSTELELQTEELQAQVAHNEELVADLAASNEELQQRTLEAEHANRAKSEFLAAMSHELRTPLNAIFGYADLIQLGVHGPITRAQDESLERIKRNQNALLLLINDVLNFAKLEAGGLKIRMDAVQVADVIADLEEVVSPQLRAKELRYECGAVEAGLRVRGDNERIQQVLLNLLTNAIKFTDRGGRIALETAADGDWIHFRVRDTGCGIPEDRMVVIFDPFVQVGRQSGESGERGVGLGLAISRDLAEAMAGSLMAESTPGEGSTFTLSLRRA